MPAQDVDPAAGGERIDGREDDRIRHPREALQQPAGLALQDAIGNLQDDDLGPLSCQPVPDRGHGLADLLTRIAEGGRHAVVQEIGGDVRARVDVGPAILPAARAGDLARSHHQSRPSEPPHDADDSGGLARIHA